MIWAIYLSNFHEIFEVESKERNTLQRAESSSSEYIEIGTNNSVISELGKCTTTYCKDKYGTGDHDCRPTTVIILC